jgi:integrase/recombinase XerD
MGRNPFLTRVESYLRDVRKPNLSTYRERSSKLRLLSRVYEDLRASDPSLRADPKCFGEREIYAFVDWMRSDGYGIAYQAKLVQYLALLLRYLGNNVVDRMRDAHADLPRAHPKRQRAPRPEDVEDTLRALESLAGWRGETMRFAVQFYYATGVRVKELRLASMRDLDLRDMMFRISHPKGEGVWADGDRTIRLPESLRVPIVDYLAARDVRCRGMGLDSSRVDPLIPAWGGKHYSEAGWKGVRVKAFRTAGIRGNFRELRPAFARRAKKGGAPIEAISKRLGHTSTNTTEAFYARIEDEDAEDEVIRAWESIGVN